MNNQTTWIFVIVFIASYFCIDFDNPDKSGLWCFGATALLFFLFGVVWFGFLFIIGFVSPL